MWEVEAFDGFLLGLLTHEVLMGAASAAGKAHFKHSLTAFTTATLVPLVQVWGTRSGSK